MYLDTCVCECVRVCAGYFVDFAVAAVVVCRRFVITLRAQKTKVQQQMDAHVPRKPQNPVHNVSYFTARAHVYVCVYVCVCVLACNYRIVS